MFIHVYVLNTKAALLVILGPVNFWRSTKEVPTFNVSFTSFRLYAERQKNHFLVHSVACLGTEVHLAACPLEYNYGNGTESCNGGMPAVVSCVPGPLYAQNTAIKKKLKVSVKFVLDLYFLITFMYRNITYLSFSTGFCTSEGWSKAERGPC